MTRQIDPQTSLKAMHDTGPLLAKAKAERVYLEEYRKSLKALLMKASQQSSAALQEREAYADESYVSHIRALQIATEEEEKLRWRMVVSQAAIEVWRTQCANDRNFDKAVS